MLETRTIALAGRRTSVALEPPFWAALAEIAAREGVTLAALCAEVERDRGALGRAAALRLYALGYFEATGSGAASGPV